MKLNVKAFGLAFGILWGVAVIIMGVVAMIFPNYCADFVRVLGTKYIGYAPTFLGSIIGGIWGFVDAGIFGLALAWLYNKLVK
jgi:hypothetical protein